MSIGAQLFLAFGGSVLISLIMTFIFNRIVVKQAEKRDRKKAQEQAELDTYHRQQRREELAADMKNLIDPVIDRIDEMENNFEEKLEQIDKKLDLNTEANVTKLRDSMKERRDNLIKKGYTTASDRANWNELYNAYANLGGNHFREYVDQWKNDVMTLPESTRREDLHNAG